MFEFDGRLLSRKAPGDGDVLLVTSSGPGSDLPCGDLAGGQPLRQALPIQSREFDLGHIQPARMLGGIMDLKALTEPTRLSDWKDLIERGKRMRVEVIHHQNDLFGGRIVLVGQAADELSPFDFASVSGHHRVTLTCQRFAGQEDVTPPGARTRNLRAWAGLAPWAAVRGSRPAVAC